MFVKKAPHVAIIEPSLAGHRGPYVSWMARGLASRGYSVTLATQPESLEHPSLDEVKERCLRDNLSLDVVTLGNSSTTSIHRRYSGLVASQFAYWLLIKTWHMELGRRDTVDAVLIPSADACLYAVALLGSPFGSSPWVGLTMRPSFHYRDMGIIAPRPSFALTKRTLFFRALRNSSLRCLLTLDESLHLYLEQGGLGSGKVMLLPEPSEFDSMPLGSWAKRQLGVNPDRLLVLLYGTITGRKGVRELVQALAHPSFPENVDVYFAGRVYADVQKLLGEPQVQAFKDEGRLKVDDRFIEESEARTLFAAADAVWLGYQGHYGPSGALIQAAAARKPVIACEDGVIGWQTRRHKLGVTVRLGDINSVVGGIRCLMTGNTGTVRPTDTSPFRTFSEDSAIDVLEAALVGLPVMRGRLKRKCGTAAERKLS